jgi:class I fructose-bisphosphate aldolase
LLNHTSTAIPKDTLHLPGPDFVDRSFAQTNRNNQVLRSLETLYGKGRLGGTGYLSILPVDQGVEHSAGASFAPNPIYFDPESIVKLAIEADCNAVASTFGVLASVSRKYAHKIPFVVKINHNEFLSMPNQYDQTLYGSVEDAWNMGAVAVGATVYFGAEESRRQLLEVAEAFERARELGMATILWCYTRNPGFKVDGVDYHTSADLSSQAIHLGVTIQADIIKQKLPTNNGGYLATKHGKTHPGVYSQLTTDHPIDLTRYQVANSYMGRQGVINSGGESKGASDLAEAVATAVINKRAGGQGLILGRKAFQRPFHEGVALLQEIQNVYLDPAVTIA